MHKDKLVKSEGKYAVEVGESKTLTGKPLQYNYRVWNALNPPSRMDWYAVGSPEEAVFVITDLAFEQLDHEGVKANAFGLEFWNELSQTWEEWYDDDGDDILMLIEKMAEEAQADLDEFEDLGPEDAIGGWYDE